MLTRQVNDIDDQYADEEEENEEEYDDNVQFVGQRELTSLEDEEGELSVPAEGTWNDEAPKVTWYSWWGKMGWSFRNGQQVVKNKDEEVAEPGDTCTEEPEEPAAVSFSSMFSPVIKEEGSLLHYRRLIDPPTLKFLNDPDGDLGMKSSGLADSGVDEDELELKPKRRLTPFRIAIAVGLVACIWGVLFYYVYRDPVNQRVA